MGLFNEPEEQNQEDEKKKNDGVEAVVIALSLLFLPSLIVGGFIYLFLRVGRLRPGLIALFVALWVTLGAFVLYLTKPLEKILTIVQEVRSLSDLQAQWVELLPFYLSLNSVVGGFVGLGLVMWTVKQMKDNPHRLQLPGSWMYKFEYRRTPLELMKKKRIINQLKSGSLADGEKSPLGLVEKGEYRPAFRYYSEANKHTLINGNSGSGKALHKDTLLPTPTGFTTVGEAQEGDYLLSPSGKPTQIIGKYQPKTEDHYLLTFSDGTTVKACGDHLWEVGLTDRLTPVRKGVKVLLSPEQIERVKNALLEDRDDPIAFSELSKAYGVTITPKLRKNADQFIVKRKSTAYSLEELVAKVKNSVKLVPEDEKAGIIAHLSKNDDPFISRSVALEVISPITLNRLTCDVTRVVQKNHLYDRKKLLSWLLEDQMNLEKDVEESLHRSSLTQVLSTRAMADTSSTVRDSARYFVEVSKAIEYEEKDLLVEPYILGAWLGDGTSSAGRICGVDQEVAERIETLRPVKEKLIHRAPRQPIYDWLVEGLHADLKTLGVLQTPNDSASKKAIPEAYLYSSVEQRKALLRGLLDTDGYCREDGMVSLGLTNENVVRAARQIVASLGWKPSPIKTHPAYAKVNGKKSYGKPVHTFLFYPDEQLFTVARKAERLQQRLETERSQQVRHKRRYVTAIEKIEDSAEDYYCFTVDDERSLFLCTESFIPTHNTITMQTLILADIKAGLPLILVDMKRSPSFASKVAAWTADHGGTFYHFVNGEAKDYDVPNSRGQSKYDPLQSGSPTSKADMVLGMREYDTASAVYKASMTQLLQVVFSMLHYADRSKAPEIDWDHGGIFQLASAVKDGNLHRLAIACEGTPVQNEAEAIYQQSQGKTQIRHAIDELQGQMRTIIASEYGAWLKTDPGEQGIDLFELTQKPGNVILFSLNSDSEPEFARYIGSMIMADLTNTSAKRRNRSLGNQVNVYIDEFQTINPSSVSSLLEKSRESKIAMTLAQQSFEQIVAASKQNGEAYLGSILDTCSNFIIHAGSTEDSAERLSKILGREVVDSYRTSNKNKSFMFSLNWNNKRNQMVQTFQEEKWKFSPARFMELSSPDKNNGFKSTAVVINKTCSDPEYRDQKGAVARTVWMIPDDRVLGQYYTPSFNDELSPSETFEEEWEEVPPATHRPAALPPGVKDEAPPARPAPPVDLEEEADGGFTYETLEEDDDVGLLSYGDEEVERYLAPKSRDDVSSAQKLWEEKKFTLPPPRPEAPPKPKRPARSGGLPTAPLPPVAPAPPAEETEDFDEDFALPDISHLFKS